MNDCPFTLFRQFEERVRIAYFLKEDDIRSDAAAARLVDASRSAGLHQVHGNRTVIVRDAMERTEPADGMITDQADLALCIRWADCQNFVIFAPEKNVLGVLHVGWRGLIAGAIPEFFSVLEKNFGIRATDTFVGAGPSLCLDCAQFTDPERELPTMPHEFIHGQNVDLRGAAQAQFLAAGLAQDRFERDPRCTRCDPQTFWTYRGGDRDQVKAGHTNMLVCVLQK